MAASTSTAAATADRELVIARTFDAPRRLVFKAWSQPEMLARWWGPRGFTLPACQMDFRPGGAFRFRMRSPEGTDHRLQGVYREIVEPERLVFTWAWEDEAGRLGPETLVTLSFADRGGKTELTLRQGVFESVTARDQHHGGWSECLDRLAAYVVRAQ
jgi:uncharacterized protein YndB with AHSA1/START domain